MNAISLGFKVWYPVTAENPFVARACFDVRDTPSPLSWGVEKAE